MRWGWREALSFRLLRGRRQFSVGHVTFIEGSLGGGFLPACLVAEVSSA